MEKFYILIEDPNLKTGISEFLKIHLAEKCEIIETLDLESIKSIINKHGDKNITLCFFGATIYLSSQVNIDNLIFISPVLNVELYEKEIAKLDCKTLEIKNKALILN